MALPLSARLIVSHRTPFSRRESNSSARDVGSPLHHQGIEGDRTARPHDERVDVELAYVVGEIHCEALHLHARRRRARRRRQASGRGRPRGALNPCSSASARRASSSSNGGTRNVTSPNTSMKMPPSPNGDDRAEQLVVRHADEHLDAAASPSRTRARLRCGRCGPPASPCASSSSYAARTSLAESTPTFTRPGVALVQQVRRRHLHHDRIADRVAAARTAAAADATQLVLRRLDPVRLQQLLELPLRQRLARS